MDRFVELREYGCVINHAAEVTARTIAGQVDATVVIFAKSGMDVEDELIEPNDGCHLCMVTADAYVMVCIDEDGQHMLARCSSQTAHYEGILPNIDAAVEFLRNHLEPNNHPELGS